MEEVLRKREELEHERLEHLQEIRLRRNGLLTETFHLLQLKDNPGRLFEESKDEFALHTFLHNASDLFLSKLEIRDTPYMADVVTMVDHPAPVPPTPPPPPPPALPPPSPPPPPPPFELEPELPPPSPDVREDVQEDVQKNELESPDDSPMSEPPATPPPLPRLVPMELGELDDFPLVYPLPNPEEEGEGEGEEVAAEDQLEVEEEEEEEEEEEPEKPEQQPEQHPEQQPEQQLEPEPEVELELETETEPELELNEEPMDVEEEHDEVITEIPQPQPQPQPQPVEVELGSIEGEDVVLLDESPPEPQSEEEAIKVPTPTPSPAPALPTPPPVQEEVPTPDLLNELVPSWDATEPVDTQTPPTPPQEIEEGQREAEAEEARNEEDQDAFMEDVEGLTDFSRGEPLAQKKSEEHVLHILEDNASEPPIPISRTTSGQYSLACLPPSTLLSPSFTFAANFVSDLEAQEEPKVTQAALRSRTINGQYSLPPLNILPPEFQRKMKPSRQSRKRDREKDKGEAKGHSEWTPMGVNRWGASIRANPVFKRIAKSTKCLSTHDWNTAITELKVIRTLEKVEQLKEAGRWSFRQPKKQRGVGGLMKTHRDYLLDEMRWMRTDFREERRWKLALAYNLAHAVIEWHEAGSLEERVRQGICVLWKRPREEGLEKGDADRLVDAELAVRDEEEDGEDSKQTSTPGDGYGTDDDSDDEQEKEQQDVLDALEPTIAVRGELDQVIESQEQEPNTPEIRPKVEDVEDLTALHAQEDNAMDIETQPADNTPPNGTAATAEQTAEVASGLKSTSTDPILGAAVVPLQSDPKPAAPKPKAKNNVYAPLREQVVFSDLDSLFVDLDDFELLKGMAELSTDDAPLPPPPPPDLSAIFPELQPYGLVDVAPRPGLDGKRKSDRRGDKDDPNKRAEDTTYTKLVPTSEFMRQKPTLLGPLHPARHWSHGGWHSLEETAVVAEFDSPSARAIDEGISCELFGNGPPSRPGPVVLRSRTPHGIASLADVKINPATGAPIKQRQVELAWTQQDDALLKQLVDKYPGNWMLVAEAFNSSRVTVPTDKRNASDCYSRWTRGINPPITEEESRATPQAQTPTTQMTTRGVKRSFSSISTPGGNPSISTTAQTIEPKRRRHSIMHEALRRAAKKRENAQKLQSAAQRKPPQVHDTHSQYSKMPRYTPAELSRMKTEKDARENHEYMLRLKRQEEAARQQRSLQGAPASPSAQNGAPRPPTNGIPVAQGVPQIRGQVNISQQQRISNQMALQNPRLNVAPSQALQAQVQARAIAAMQQAAVQAQVQAQAQPQAAIQAQVQAQPSMPSSLAANVAPALSTAHLSPPFATRTASSSPGLPQQSPPILAGANAAQVPNATSPRPPSTQPHAAMTAAQQATSRTALAHYLTSTSPNLHQQQLTPEQVDQAHRLRLLLQQQAAIQQQQQQAAHNNGYPQP